MPTNKVDSRTKILETASKLFQLQGYYATGINQIIKESGLPKGSIYHHFPNGKEELAIEAVKFTGTFVESKIKEVFSRLSDPIEAFQVHIQSIAEQFNTPENIEGFPIGLLASETALTSEPLRTACEHAYSQWQRLYEEKLSEFGMDEACSKEYAQLINAMIEGGIILSLTQKNSQPLLSIAGKIPQIIKS